MDEDPAQEVARQREEKRKRDEQGKRGRNQVSRFVLRRPWSLAVNKRCRGPLVRWEEALAPALTPILTGTDSERSGRRAKGAGREEKRARLAGGRRRGCSTAQPSVCLQSAAAVRCGAVQAARRGESQGNGRGCRSRPGRQWCWFWCGAGAGAGSCGGAADTDPTGGRRGDGRCHVDGRCTQRLTPVSATATGDLQLARLPSNTRHATCSSGSGSGSGSVSGSGSGSGNGASEWMTELLHEGRASRANKYSTWLLLAQCSGRWRRCQQQSSDLALPVLGCSPGSVLGVANAAAAIQQQQHQFGHRYAPSSLRGTGSEAAKRVGLRCRWVCM